MRKKTISVVPEQSRVESKSGESIAQSLHRGGVEINMLCGGKGRCGKCKVRVERGRATEPTLNERELLPAKAIDKGYRLACQADPLEDIELFIPVESLPTVYKLQTEGLITEVEPEPNIRKLFLKVAKPDIEKILSDEDRLLLALREQHGVEADMSYSALLKLPKVLRETDGEVTAVLGGSMVFAVEGRDTTKQNYGMAIDLGTSKIAGFIMHLDSGTVLHISSFFNPQKKYGGDIISRITYASEGRNELESIQARAVKGINKLVNRIVDECCYGAGISKENIYEMSMVGNTAMIHLLLGFDPSYVGRSPFPPVRKRSIVVPSKELGIKINPSGSVYTLPLLGGFVGADAVGVCLAKNLIEAREPVMVLDVGTNNEIMLGDERGVVATSSPSGPAFEGAHISHGMRASNGAIESVFIDPVTGELRYKTINERAPRGICGSGMVDLVAEMLKAGIIQRRGRFNLESSERVRKGDHGMEYLLVTAEDSATGEDIVFTQKDMGEFLKAKAALHSGAEIVMRRKGVEERGIKKLLLAGAFGSYIKPESARTVGMIPEVPLERVQSIGNAAGTGSRMALISTKMRKEAERISREVEHFHLERDASFKDEFMASIYLPHRYKEKYSEVERWLKKLRQRREKAEAKV